MLVGQVAFGNVLRPPVNDTTFGSATNPYANFQPDP